MGERAEGSGRGRGGGGGGGRDDGVGASEKSMEETVGEGVGGLRGGREGIVPPLSCVRRL